MDDQQKAIEPKKVNPEKIKLLNNEQLQERIKEIPIKIRKKQDYYSKLNQINQERLKVYVAYQRENEIMCKKMLSERQKPVALAAGEKKTN